MSNLTPRPTNRLAQSIPDGFSRTEGKELSRLQNKEIARGLIAGTRVQAAGMVADSAGTSDQSARTIRASRRRDAALPEPDILRGAVSRR